MTESPGLAWLRFALLPASGWNQVAMTPLSGMAGLGKAYIIASQWVEPGGNDRIIWFGLAR